MKTTAVFNVEFGKGTKAKKEVQAIYYDIKDSGMTDANKIKVGVHYQKAGHNWADGNYEEGGYYANVTPVKVDEKDDYSSESFMLLSGGKTLVLPCERRSTKREIEAYNEVLQGKVQWLIDKICTKHKITLEQ